MTIDTQYVSGKIRLTFTFDATKEDHDMRLVFLAQNVLKQAVNELRPDNSVMPGLVSPSIEAERSEKRGILQALLHAFDAVHHCCDAHVSTTDAVQLSNGGER